jgi:hypothetical protein
MSNELNTQATRHQEIAEEKVRTLKAELERERGDYMASIKNLLANTQGRHAERSRAGFMEEDESSADEGASGRKYSRSGLGTQCTCLY